MSHSRWWGSLNCGCKPQNGPKKEIRHPTARKQIASLVSILEPEAALSGFQDPGNLDTGTAAILALLQQNSSAIQSALHTGIGNLNAPN